MEKKTLLPNGGYPMHTFEDLKEVYFPYITLPENRKLIEDAYKFALKKDVG